jgi:hypothetical protein
MNNKNSRSHFVQKQTSIRLENNNRPEPFGNNNSSKETKDEKVFNVIKNVKKENILNDSTHSNALYESFPTNIYIYTSYDVGECHHCRHSYNGHGIGIPIKRIDVQKNNFASTVYRGLIKDLNPECKILYIVKDCFCSFECAYANILQHPNRKLQEEILGYFMELFNTSYPEQTLIPAGDYRLTKKFGGPFTIEQYRKNGHLYKQASNIVCVPELSTFQIKH